MTRITRITLALIAAPVVATMTTAAVFVLTGAHHRIGATREEARAALPGDDILPDAGLQSDHATTIAAPPSAVWPWIAQLGQDKGGFYSWEVLENAIGCDITNAERIVSEWQRPQVGEPFPLAPGVELRVALVDPPRTFVASSLGGATPSDMEFDFTWTFALTPADGGAATRLHVRERYRTSGTWVRVAIEAIGLVSALMTDRMLRTIKRLAEANPLPSRSS
ncbi:MAG: SRPBCC family protein [Actinomycetota bacterium]